MTQAGPLAKAVSNFGTATRAKLSNIAASGQREDQLRGPLEDLVEVLAEIAGQPKGATVLVGETAHAETGTRPDYSVTVGDALVGFMEVKAPANRANTSASLFASHSQITITVQPSPSSTPRL